MKNSIKKTISIMLAVVLLLTAAPMSGFVGLKLNLDWLNFDWLDFSTKSSALDATGQCGENVYWTFDETTGLLTISGTGNMGNYNWNDSPFYNNNSIKTVVIELGVTSIGSYAFFKCNGLTSVTIGNSVMRIGENAFNQCNWLANVTIGNSVTSIENYAFYCCSGLTSVIIGNSVTSIGNGAFDYCTGLTSVTIPDSVTSIENYAFYGCSSLTKVNISSIEAWCNISFSDYESNPLYYAHNLYLNDKLVTDLVIPDEIASIGNYAFYNCTALASVTIGNSVTSISHQAFFGCRGLTSITIPDSVTSIESNAFWGCTGLTSVTIPDSVTSIDHSAFPIDTIFICNNSYAVNYAQSNNFKYLIAFVPEGEEAVINEQVTSKLNYTLNKETRTLTIDCSEVMPSFQSQDPPWKQYDHYIEHIIISEGCTKISYNAFKDLFILSVTIPSTVTAIDAYSFNNCVLLSSVTIPDSVTSISDYAFEGCTGLTSVTIPGSMTRIGNYVFRGCTGLTSVTIPDSVTSIGYSAFSGCTGLTSMTIGNSLTSIGWDAFCNCTGLKELTLPCSASYLNSFSGCTGIEKVTLTVGSGMMENYSSSSYDETPWYYSRNSIKSITLEEGITSIGSYAFYECSDVNISIPSTVTSIGNYAFYGCTTMEDVVLSENVQSIGASSFANVKTIKVYNRNCTFGADCIPYNATIYGYAGSTAEAFANENGYDFVYLGEGHEHLYDNNCDAVCNICGFTRTVTHTYDNDCDDTCNICGAKRTPNHHFAWVTVTNPTVENDGLMQKKCSVCGAVEQEITMPHLIPNFVTGIALSPKTIALNVGETADITAIVTPETAQNKNIIWSSTDSENVTVSDGTITAVRPGTSVIIAETQDGGYRDFCLARVISITAANGSVVDSDSGLIYGLAPKLQSIDGFVDTLDETLSVVCDDDIIGTGSVIQIIRNGEPVDTYQAVIFGDVNSDGIYDGQDAFIVNCIANGLLTREQVGEAKHFAADCNHDGEVNALDVAILEQAGLLLSRVDQTQEDYAETDAYAEYLDLIDQTLAGEDDAPEAPEESQLTVIERIITFIKMIIDFIRSFTIKF